MLGVVCPGPLLNNKGAQNQRILQRSICDWARTTITTPTRIRLNGSTCAADRSSLDRSQGTSSWRWWRARWRASFPSPSLSSSPSSLMSTTSKSKCPWCRGDEMPHEMNARQLAVATTAWPAPLGSPCSAHRMIAVMKMTLPTWACDGRRQALGGGPWPELRSACLFQVGISEAIAQLFKKHENALKRLWKGHIPSILPTKLDLLSWYCVWPAWWSCHPR